MLLYFLDKKGQQHLIKEVFNDKDCTEAILEDVQKKYHSKPPYFNCSILKDNTTLIDFGNWYEFYKLNGILRI